MLKLTPSTRGSSKGLGVVWSDLKPKAHHRSTQDANDLLNYDQLFQIWDVDNDGMMSVVEICWGLRRQNDQITRSLPLLMFARLVRHLEVLLETNENPDWHMYDSVHFKELLFVPASGEAGDPYFVTRYATQEYLESILPAHSMEVDQIGKSQKQSKHDLHSNDNSNGTKKISIQEFDGKKVKTRIEKVFEAWDTNDDKCLDIQEIRTALRNSAGKTEPPVLTEGERGDMVEYIRTLEEQNENLSWHELDIEDFEKIVTRHLC